MDILQYFVVGIILVVSIYLLFTICMTLYAMREADKRMKQMEKELNFEDDFFN